MLTLLQNFYFGNFKYDVIFLNYSKFLIKKIMSAADIKQRKNITV